MRWDAGGLCGIIEPVYSRNCGVLTRPSCQGGERILTLHKAVWLFATSLERSTQEGGHSPCAIR